MDIKKEFIPTQVRGWVNDILDSDTDWHFWYPWLENLKNTQTFVHLSASWSNDKSWPILPDPGYDQYVLSGDSGMSGWAEHVAQLYEKPIFVIELPEVYQPSQHALVHSIPNTYYHKQIERLSTQYTAVAQKKIIYKASSLVGRITQSKVIVFSALERYLKNDCFLSLHDRLQLQNVHNWGLTQNKKLDELTLHFKENWINKTLIMDNDDQDQLSINIPAYTQAALNFTQESFHYSLMYNSEKNYSEILSGPFLTEKTFKCLLSKTAFIPVGQFRSYAWLRSAGMKFDYGLNLSFDNDEGNITRLSKLVDLINDISKYSAQDLYEMTQSSTDHNYLTISSGEFDNFCKTSNAFHLSTLYEKILGQC